MSPSQNGVVEPPRANALRLLWGRLKEHPLARVGPGLITGVADDDPERLQAAKLAKMGARARSEVI
jgi:hypothetical protein